MTKPERDAIWDEVARIWFCGDVKRPHRKAVGRIVQDFVDLEATPKEIRKRLRAYKDAWPGMECSARALVVHWCRFAPKREVSFVVTGDEPATPAEEARDIIGQIRKQGAA